MDSDPDVGREADLIGSTSAKSSAECSSRVSDSRAHWVCQTDASAGLHTEGSLSPSFRASVWKNLVDEYHFQDLLNYRRLLKAEWDYEFYLKVKTLSPEVELKQLQKLCNKLTALYWIPFPSTDNNEDALPQLPLGCVLREWFHYHNGEPNIEHENHFANIIRVYPGGPESISQVITAHNRIFDQASSFLENISHHETPGVKSQGPWKESDIYQLKPTYRAIILIMDRLVEPHMEELEGRARVRLAKHAKRQSVLLVRLRDLDSVLVDFTGLKEQGLCLPLERADIDIDTCDVVRVSLSTAVQYIADLEKQEEGEDIKIQALENAKRRAEAWADEQMKEVDEKRFGKSYDVQLAIQRAQALRMGEEPEPFEPNPLNNSWIE